MAVNEDGKFTKKDKETVRLIEEAFAMDCSKTEACLNANISRQTLYDWMKEDTGWAKRLDKLKATPFLLARKTIVKGIRENTRDAFEYMKRKNRKEFGDNVDLTSDGNELKPVLVKFIDGDKDTN
jgi:hypothetical protein